MPMSGSAAWSVAVSVTAYSRWRSLSNFLAVTIVPGAREITRLMRRIVESKELSSLSHPACSRNKSLLRVLTVTHIKR